MRDEPRERTWDSDPGRSAADREHFASHLRSAAPPEIRSIGSQPLGPNDPRRIGRYDLLAQLGCGGMGAVYLGRSPDSTLVAIKLIHSHLALDVEFRARFSREAQAGRRVPPFCSARVLDSGEHDNRPYLVTEYIDGVPLSQFVAEDGPLDLPSLHGLALGIAAGLAAIHTAGLVHRDVKPSNIMMTMGGIRIIDFGIARALDDTTSFTRSGVVMGSLGWAAPEQLSGQSPSPAMDIFGWGCVIGFAAVGEHPFGGTDLSNRAWRVLHQRPDVTRIPEPIRSLVAWTLDPSPQARPTATELLLALIGAVETAKNPRRRPDGQTSQGRVSRKAAGLVLAGLPAALVMVIAATGGLRIPTHDEGSPSGNPLPGSSASPGGPAASGTPGGSGGGSRPNSVDYIPRRPQGSAASQPIPSGSEALEPSKVEDSGETSPEPTPPPGDPTTDPKPSKTKKKKALATLGPTWPVLVPPPIWPPVLDKPK
jgi:serine/threonine protein kinase